MSSIEHRLHQVRDNMAQAALKSGRKPQDIRLVAVTKTLPLEAVTTAVHLGVEDIGENKPQELQQKYTEFQGNVSWHMIGHLQSNKVKYIIDKVRLIHSLDRMSLAKEIEKRAAGLDLEISALVQVNVAEEESKFGLAMKEVIPFLEKLQQMPHIGVKGLMTMAPFYENTEHTRPVFSKLRQLKDKITALDMPHVSMDILSMGMSNDYVVAIEEGATMVRVGSALFGQHKLN